ncbi:hypothetical protein AK88_00190 [Plasmodium fragile]|uniref:Uncharacterized protein n=1 Tax=Plasmodium fragile TaxID=5857 RepID=A0A0D9QU96_PLAFR|nr:uncharacterized protein AK88_00190 [Plasmodium fragile]KJP90021.1 hypothetical protein AK88_00190 [Plasmodium fragile]
MEESKEGTPLENKRSENEEPEKGKTSSSCKKVKMVHKTKSNEKKKKSSKNCKTYKRYRYFKPFRQFKNSKSLKNVKNSKSQKKREKEQAKKKAKRKAKKNALKNILPVEQARSTEVANEGDVTLGNVEKQLSNELSPMQNSAKPSNSSKSECKNISTNAEYVALHKDKIVPKHSDEKMRGNVNNDYEIKGSVDEDNLFSVHMDVATEKTPCVEAPEGDSLNYVVEKNSPNKAKEIVVTIQHCQKNSCREENCTVLKPHMGDPQTNYCGGEEEEQMAHVNASRTSKQSKPSEPLPDMHHAQHEAEATHHLIGPLGEKQTCRIQFRELIASMKEDTKNIVIVMENLSEEKLLYMTIPFSENYDIIKYFNFLSLEKIKKMINLLHVDNYKNFIFAFNKKKIIEIVNHVSVNTAISVLLNMSNNKVAYILNHIEENVLINLLNGIPLCKFYHIAECLPMQKISLCSTNITYEKLYVMHNLLPSKKLHQVTNNLSVQTLSKLINELPLYKSVKVLKMLPPCKIAHSINVKELTPQFASEIGRSFSAPEIIEIVNYLNEGNAYILLSRCNLTKIILYINYISMEEFKSVTSKLPTEFLTQIVNDISLKLLVELFLSLPEDKAVPCLYALTQRKLNSALRIIPMQTVIIDMVLRQVRAVQGGYHPTESTMDVTAAAHPHRHLVNMIDEHNLAFLLKQLKPEEYVPFCNFLCQEQVQHIANSNHINCQTAAACILHLPLTKMMEILQTARQKRREEMTKYMPTFVSHMVLQKSSNRKYMNKIEQMFITCKLLRLRKVFRNSKKMVTLGKKKKKLKYYHLRKKTNDIIRSINVKNYSKFVNSISCTKIVEMNRVIDNIMCKHPYTEPKVMECLFVFFNFLEKIETCKWKTDRRNLRWITKDNWKSGEHLQDTCKQTKLCPCERNTKICQLSPSPEITKRNPSLDNTTIRKIITHEKQGEANYVATKTGKCNPTTNRVRISFYTFLVHLVCFIKMHIENYVLQSFENWHDREREEEHPSNRQRSDLPLKGALAPNHEEASTALLHEDSRVIESHPHCITTSKMMNTTNSKLIFKSVRKIMKNIFYSVRMINQIGNPSLVLKHISMLNIIRADIIQCRSELPKEDLKKRSEWDYSTETPIKSIHIKDGRATLIGFKKSADVIPQSSNFFSAKCLLAKNIFNEMKKKNCTKGTRDGEEYKEAVTIEDGIKKIESDHTIEMSQNSRTTCTLKEGDTVDMRNFSTNERRPLIKKSKKNYFKKLKNIPQMASFKRFKRTDQHRSSEPREGKSPNVSINTTMETCQIDRQSRNTTANPPNNKKAFFPIPNSKTGKVLPSDVSNKGGKNKVSLLKFMFALNDSNAKRHVYNITLIIKFAFLKKKIFLSKCKNQIVGSSLNVLINDNGCKRLFNFSAPPNDTSCYINSNIVSLHYDDTDAIKNLYSLTSNKSVPMCTTPEIIPSTIPHKEEPKNRFKNKKSSTEMNKLKNNMSIKNMCNDLNSSIILLWKSSQCGYIFLDAHNSLHINIHDPSSQFSLNLFRQHDDFYVGGNTYRKSNLYFPKKGKKKMSFKKIKSMFSRILEKTKSAPVANRSSGPIMERGQGEVGGDMKEERPNVDIVLDRTALHSRGKNVLNEGKGDTPGDVKSRRDNCANGYGPKPEEPLICEDNEVYFGDEYYKCYEGEVPSASANVGSHLNGESIPFSDPLEPPRKNEETCELSIDQQRATNLRTPKSEHAHDVEKSRNEKNDTNETNAYNKHSIVINKFSNIINEAQRVLSIKEKIINKKILEQIHSSYISPNSLTESEKEKMREIKNNELNKIMEEELRKENKNFQSKDEYSFGNTNYTDDELNIMLYLEKRKKKKDQKGTRKKKQLIAMKRKENYFIPFRFNQSKILKLKLLTLIENALCSYDVNIGEGTLISTLDQQRQGETTKEYIDSSAENITNGFRFSLEQVPSNSSHNLAEQSICSFLNSNASQKNLNVDMVPLNGNPNWFQQNRLTLTNPVGDVDLFGVHDAMCNNNHAFQVNINTGKNEQSAPSTNCKILPNETNKKKEHSQDEQHHNRVDIAPLEPCHSSTSILLVDKYPLNKCSLLHLSNHAHNNTNTHTNRTCESSYEIVNSVTMHDRNNSTKGSSSNESNRSLNDDTDVNKISTFENELQLFRTSNHHSESVDIQGGTDASANGRNELGEPRKEVLLRHSSLFYKHDYNNLETHSNQRGDSTNDVNQLDQVATAFASWEKGEGDAPLKKVEQTKRCDYIAPHIVGHCNQSEHLHLELCPLEKCAKRNDLYNNPGQNRVAQHDDLHLREQREYFLNGLLSHIHSEQQGDDHFDRNSIANPHSVLGAEQVGLLNLHCLFENKSENFCLISEGCTKASNYVNDSMLIHTKMYNEMLQIQKDDMSTSDKCSMLGMSIASNSSNLFSSHNSDRRHSDSTEKQIMCIHKKKKILCNSCGNVLKKNVLKDLFCFRVTIINKKSFLSKRVKIKIYYQSPLIRANFASKDNVRYSLEKNMTEYKLNIIAINKKKIRKKLSLSKSKFFRKCLEIQLISSLDNMLISQGEEKKGVSKCSGDGTSVHSSMDHFNTYKDDLFRDNIETGKNLSYEHIKNYSKRLSSMNQSSNDVPPAIYNSHFAILNFSILDDKNKKKYDVERFIVPSTLFYTNG